MLVVIGTDCIGSYQSNYHTITSTTTPLNIVQKPEISINMNKMYLAKTSRISAVLKAERVIIAGITENPIMSVKIFKTDVIFFVAKVKICLKSVRPIHLLTNSVC